MLVLVLVKVGSTSVTEAEASPVAWIIQGLFQDPARFMLVAKGKVDAPIGRAWM